jgi:phosphohistidine swiveling domain-containing protein
MKKQILSGLSANSGIVSGNAKLVFNIDDVNKIQQGDILVTTMTNPDMIVGMHKAAAIITDVGGMICHAAIVSRELNIPCIVGTGNATKTISENQTITVDGDRGLVYEGIVKNENIKSNTLSFVPFSEKILAFDSLKSDYRIIPKLSSIEMIELIPNISEEIIVYLHPDLVQCGEFYWQDLSSFSKIKEKEKVLNSISDKYFNILKNSSIRSILLIGVNGSDSINDFQKEFISKLNKELDINISFFEQDTNDELVFDIDGKRSYYCIDKNSDVNKEEIGDDVILMLSPKNTHIIKDYANYKVGIDFTSAFLLKNNRKKIRDISLPKINIENKEGRYFGTIPEKLDEPMPKLEKKQFYIDQWEDKNMADIDLKEHMSKKSFTWLNIRPEIPLSAYLVSQLIRGFETPPYYLGFPEFGMIYTKHVKGRTCFRKDKVDSFMPMYKEKVHTDDWFNHKYLIKLHENYLEWDKITDKIFSQVDEFSKLSSSEIVSIYERWWKVHEEFFGLCFYIQSMGDDFFWPRVKEIIETNIRRYEQDETIGLSRYTQSLSLPTENVLSASYFKDLSKIYYGFKKLSIDSKNIQEIMGEAKSSENGKRWLKELSTFKDNWGWMRDRDLFFDPLDNNERIINLLLKQTAMHDVESESNFHKNRLTILKIMDEQYFLSKEGNYDKEFLKYLLLGRQFQIERENHHIIWIRNTGAIRLLLLEIADRLINKGIIKEYKEIFFIQIPEIFDLLNNNDIPEIEELIKNRKNVFYNEMKLNKTMVDVIPEDNYN